jgi:hypothetical protein
MITATLWYFSSIKGLSPSGWLYFLTVILDATIVNKIIGG